MIEPDDRVYLRACSAGEPGTVIRQERAKLTDLDYRSKHRLEALEIIGVNQTPPHDGPAR